MGSRYEVEVKVGPARDLKNVNWRNGGLKPYVVLWVDDGPRCSSRVDDGENPVWDEKLIVPLPPSSNRFEDAILCIDVVHANAAEGTKPLVGFGRLTLREVIDDAGIGGRVSRFLRLKLPSGRLQGRLHVCVSVREPSRSYDASPAYPPPGQTIASRDPYAYSSGGHGAPASGVPATYAPQQHAGYSPAYGAPPQSAGYPAAYDTAPPQSAGYPTAHGAAPSRSAGYPAAHGAAPPQSAGYPAAYGAAPPQSAGYPDAYGAAPTQSVGYPTAHNGTPQPQPAHVAGGQGSAVEDPKKKKGMGMGTGLAVGAAAGVLGGLAIAGGASYLGNKIDEKIEDKVEERVEEELAARDSYDGVRGYDDFGDGGEGDGGDGDGDGDSGDGDGDGGDSDEDGDDEDGKARINLTRMMTTATTMNKPKLKDCLRC